MRVTKAKRRSTPPKIETSVLVKSRRRCALCFHLNGDAEEQRGQIAHLDRDPSNFKNDNLAFLCLDHHSQYDSRSSQHKGYTEPEVRQARERLYEWLRRSKPPIAGRQLKAYSLPPLRLEASASGFARLVRGEGYTELVGEIDIRIVGRTESMTGGCVEAEILVTMPSNITNRIDTQGLTDVALVSGRGRIVARARIGQSYNPGNSLGITFRALSRNSTELPFYAAFLVC